MRKKHIGMKAKTTISNSIIYIILVVLSILWLFPFFYIFIQSIRGDTQGVSLTMFPKNGEYTFENYILLFTDKKDPFLTWYLNTLVIALITSVVQTVIVLMVAYTLSRLRFKGRKQLMQMMLIIGMFPGFLSMIAIYKILQAIGLQTSIFGLILVYIAGSAMNYYVAKGFFDTIPKSLDEAAMIDGASKNTIFWRIIIPLSKPIVVYTILTAFLAPWGDFMMSSYLVGRGESKYFTVAVGLQQWLQIGIVNYFFTRFCAGGVVVSILPTCLFFWLQKYYVEGVTGGSVKG